MLEDKQRYAGRRAAALEGAVRAGAAGLLSAHLADVRWLSGFTGSSAAVAMGPRGAALFTDGRYTTQARAECPGLKVVVGKGSPAAQAATWLAEQGVARCAFDTGQTTIAGLAAMKLAVPGKVRRGFFVPTAGVVAGLRQIKDAGEVRQMRRAAALGCELFDQVLEFVEAGATEAEVALALEVKARMAGAEGMSFETIVCGGQRSALPHGRASQAKLPRRGFVILDFGVVLRGYCSDMTRTVHLGKASQREWDVYHSVLEAQQAAVATVAAGVSCAEVDEAARSVLRRAKLAKAFSHSTGHGVGLEIHEAPRVAAGQQETLQAGMVITVEPGVYFAGEFGVRIEDTVLVTAKGCEVLTQASPKAWMEL